MMVFLILAPYGAFTLLMLVGSPRAEPVCGGRHLPDGDRL